MGQIGDGTGSAYPAALDTDTTQYDFPDSRAQIITASWGNDVQAAILAIQAELGAIGSQNFLRRDGTLAMTAALDLGAFGLTNTGPIAGATTGSFSSTVNFPSGIIQADGKVGIGTTSPGARLTIQEDSLGLNLFQFLKPDGSNLLRAMWDGTNFHHYLGGDIYENLGGYSHVIDGNGSIASSLYIIGAASLKLDPNIDGSSYGIKVGDGTYATAATPLVTGNLLHLSTWAWNGTNGYSIRTDSVIGQVQQSTTAGDARFFIKNTVGSEVLSVDLPSGNVGIGTTAPTEKLDVAGNILATGTILG